MQLVSFGVLFVSRAIVRRVAGRVWLSAVLLLMTVTATACVGAIDSRGGQGAEADITLDPQTREARQQYEANLAFARDYQPRCPSGPATRPRVLLAGFGGDNASGLMVSRIVPEAHYSTSDAPRAGHFAAPEAQVTVGARLVRLPDSDIVADVCAIVLPVQWDLAAVLVAREVDGFQPSFVMLNGVDAPRQPIRLELGAANLALPSDDSVGLLMPMAAPGDVFATLVDSAPPEEYARGNLLSWDAVRDAGRSAVRLRKARRQSDLSFDDIATGVALGGFPRGGNLYICNNVTYTVGYLMDHPGETVQLMRASGTHTGAVDGVAVTMHGSHVTVPRVFVHWPGELVGAHLLAATEVMTVLMGAQLAAMARGDVATRGRAADADSP